MVAPPRWIKPQLTRLIDEAPTGSGWLHEIKHDGYPSRIDGRDIKLLTRTGLDWSHRYRRTIEALGSLNVKSVYLDVSYARSCPVKGVCKGSCAIQLPRMRRSRVARLTQVLPRLGVEVRAP